MKLNNLALFLLVSTIFTINVFASTESTFREDMLEFGLPIINSTDEKDILPHNFRMSKVVTLPNDNTPNLEGLSDLKMSGSAQFSEASLDALIKRIGQKNITIVNLRQEDGGFIEPVEGKGAIAFSYLMSMPWWTGEDPRGNRSLEEIEASEENRMQKIMKNKTYTMYGSSDSYAPSDTHQLLYRIQIAVKRAITEKQLVSEKGLNYFRIPDKKFGNMEYEHVDQFIEFVKNLPANTWVHFHCKKGQSRTTLFMIMYDMMHHADKVSTEDIIKRQGPDGLGGADLFGLPNKQDWDHSFKKGWKDFLYQFHQYVKENKSSHFEKSWTEWANESGITPLPPVILADYYKDTTVHSLLPQDDVKYEHPVLALNTLNESKLKVQNFRSSDDLWLDPNVEFDHWGLKDLHASGSNQYSPAGLGILFNRLKKTTNNIVVVDLRHDDHLFINGLNVSSFETKEALLKPRTPEMIKESELNLKATIKGLNAVEIHAIETKYPKDSFDDRFSLQLVPVEVETPEELVNRLGANYLLVGTKRFSEASDDDIDRFINYYRQMPPDTWYHFHCKKGKSRTTFFLTLYDMMLNADHLDAGTIIRRQHVIGGSNLLDITPKDPSWSEERESKKQWIVFLLRFYKYAAENKANNFAKPWAEWSQENQDYQPNVDHLVIDHT